MIPMTMTMTMMTMMTIDQEIFLTTLNPAMDPVSVQLTDDVPYLVAKARESAFPGMYATYISPGTCGPRARSMQCRQFNVGGRQIDAYNKLVNGYPTRVISHGIKPHTELWGGGFKARGDGELIHADVAGALRLNGIDDRSCCRQSSEVVNVAWTPWEYLNAQTQVEPWGTFRAGINTRMPPVYVTSFQTTPM